MSTLTARKPMKRTGFKRKQPVSIYKTAALGPSMTLIEKREAEREKRLADIAKSAIANALERTANVALVSLSAPTAQVEKENPLRSEAYRRAVASLPCIHCGIDGYSQHAHENAGKGKSMKADDRCAMPLCCTRPGIEGCHAAFDRNLRGKPRGSARGSSEQAGTACGATSVASGQLACEVQQGQPHQPLPTAMRSGE